MKRILITGGTVFVSRYIAEYYVDKGHEVYVLNRNTKQQSTGVTLIEADRRNIGNKLKGLHFDVVLDVTAYDDRDILDLISSLYSFDDYIMISSSAVYPEYAKQPFKEDTQVGENKYWGKYGTDKIKAESTLLNLVPNAYIIRPPYLYGPINNLYREAFVFDCALLERKFCLPKNGELKLQFFHVEDLCRFIDKLIETKPPRNIYNVGNSEAVTVRDWVDLCYSVAGKEVEYIDVHENINQRDYFCFHDYEYCLDTSLQHIILPQTKPLADGLRESFNWYTNNQEKVKKKDYFAYIDRNIFE